MPPIPEPPNLLHFDIDDEALLLLRSTANPKCYSSLEESSVSLLENGGGDETETASSSSSPLLRIWSSYYNALTLRPVLVKSGTALILMILADMSAQAVEHLRKAHHGEDVMDGPSIDWLRALRFGVFGLIGAPWTHYYYYWLDAVLPPTEQPWTWTTAAKVFIDQFIQAPVMLALIVSGLAFMEGLGWDGIVVDMQHQYVPALLNNWTLWVPATIVNIAFVTPVLRVLYDNLVFFFWTIYLSMVLNK